MPGDLGHGGTSDKTEMAWVKLLESAKKARRILRRLNRSYMKVDDMANLLTVISARPDVLETWLRFLRYIDIHGARGLFEDLKQEADELEIAEEQVVSYLDEWNEREPWLIPPIRTMFADTCRMEFNARMLMLDPLTQLGSIEVEEDDTGEPWELYNPIAFLSWCKPGNDAILKGPRKRGKTNFALLLAELAIAQGMTVIGNIDVRNPPDGYHYVSTLSAMLEEICKARMRGENVLLLFDEGGLAWAKIETVRPKNIDLSKLALCFGKMHLNMLFISHYQELIPTIIAKTASAEFEKLSKTTIYVEIRDGTRTSGRAISGVPATTLKYNPDELQYFGLDMEVSKLFDFMASIPKDQDQWEAVLKYVARYKGRVGPDALERDEVIRYLWSQGGSINRISQAMGGLSTAVVHRVLNEKFGIDTSERREKKKDPYEYE